MILGKYIITKHAIERYEERVGIYSKADTRKCIEIDLHFSKIKRIVSKPNGNIHVFARHSVEFVFEKKKNTLLLITVMKHNRQSTKGRINLKQHQADKLKRKIK